MARLQKLTEAKGDRKPNHDKGSWEKLLQRSTTNREMGFIILKHCLLQELFSSHLALTFPYLYLASAMQSPCQSCDAPSRTLLYAGQYLQFNF